MYVIIRDMTHVCHYTRHDSCMSLYETWLMYVIIKDMTDELLKGRGTVDGERHDPRHRHHRHHSDGSSRIAPQHEGCLHGKRRTVLTKARNARRCTPSETAKRRGTRWLKRLVFGNGKNVFCLSLSLIEAVYWQMSHGSS